MATSRYDTGATNSGRSSSANSAGGSSGSGQTQTQAQTQTQDMSSATSAQNMTPESLAALEKLIAQLLGGGTPQMRQDMQARQNEVATLNQARAGYSREAAFHDANGAMNQQLRQVLEKLLPSINNAAAGAGASQSSMRALLTQKAALQASEAASALGLNAAVQYGNVSNGIGDSIGRILAIQDPATAALINALGVSKGAIQNSNATGSTTTRTDSTNATTGSPFGATSSGNSIGSTFAQYGPSDNSSTQTSQAAMNKALIESLGGYTSGAAGYTF